MREKQGLEVIIRDLATNPRCKHGPTILFSSKNSKFFTCSSNRSKDCFFMKYEQFKRIKDTVLDTESMISTNRVAKVDVKSISPQQRHFCMDCNLIVDYKDHTTVAQHKMKNITNEMFKQPSLFLPQLDDNKINAQYFFDDLTLNFINSISDGLKLNNIICLGAPRLHDFMRNLGSKKSILLDIDDRFQQFYPDDFCHYNMFNNYFFNGHEDEEKLNKFIKNHSNKNDANSYHCVFMDPPFAARTELLAQTFATISSLYFKLTRKILPIFLVFPYFNEHHIRKFMPQMEMMDFQVTYMNHKAFNQEYKGRKSGSIVRIFTNVPQNLIKYPKDLKKYQYCKPCDRYVVKTTDGHCLICNTCPSKNGSSYRHCMKCMKCVKPNYSHCKNCNRCVQKNHDCKSYQTYQVCMACNEKGHVEKNCMRNRKKRKCLN